jgi:hypothetical protein
MLEDIVVYGVVNERMDKNIYGTNMIIVVTSNRVLQITKQTNASPAKMEWETSLDKIVSVSKGEKMIVISFQEKNPIGKGHSVIEKKVLLEVIDVKIISEKILQIMKDFKIEK